MNAANYKPCLRNIKSTTLKTLVKLMMNYVLNLLQAFYTAVKGVEE